VILDHNSKWGLPMKIKIVVHEAEEGGYWAEVLAIPGCATQGDDMDELLQISARSLRDAFQSSSRHLSQAALSGCWNCLHETGIRS